MGPTRPLSIRVDLQQAQELQRLLQNENGNDLLRSSLQATWAVLLRCYTGLNEVCFGFEEVGGSSQNDSNDELPSSPAVSLELDGDMSLEHLTHQAHTASSTPFPSNLFQFNTSILIRHAISPSSIAKSSTPNTKSQSTVMPDEV